MALKIATKTDPRIGIDEARLSPEAGSEADGMNWSEQAVLVTGGTGSFGKKFIEIMLKEYHPKRLVIFSRDELKQHDMRAAGFDHPSLRYFLGDVRDVSRLERAFAGVTVVTPSRPFRPTSWVAGM